MRIIAPSESVSNLAGAAWRENLVITTPEERRPESAVKVTKASVATRVSPKS
jgi:hypothetical protein